MRMTLTEESIKRVRRPAQGQLLIWDDKLPGFGVRLTPTMKGAAAYVIQWRETSGRSPRESLRPYWPQLKVEKARELARARLQEAVTIKQSPGSEALHQAMRRWYDRQVELGAWRPRYRDKVSSIIATYFELLPNARVKLSTAARKAAEDLAQKPVIAVTRAEVMRLINALKPGIGEQVMAIGSSYYNTALEEGVDATNPFRNRLRVTGGRRQRSRLLTDAEFVTLWRAFEAEGDPAFGAFQLLAFTGARRREVTQMLWRELDLKERTWTLPPERRKTGRHDLQPFIFHLHPSAAAVIERQPRLEGNDHVLWGRRDRKPFDFQYALMQRLRAIEVADWRLHDVRRYMRSGLGRLGVGQMTAELCLGHTGKGGLVQVYDRYDYAVEKSEAWQKWGDYLVKLTSAA